ncbi:MAG: exopolysaccharide biosynthesis protein [Rickettsiales bacterium]|jgi:hypothetical protein|nr:exopolysaccharide biosynthesis protein [Rickettsiales bacterium]
MTSQQIPASQLLQELVEKKKSTKTISLGEINEHLNERGFALLMILFSFPMAIPLPYPPGFTTILGLPLLFFSIQMLLGMDKPSLPEWIAKKTIQTSHLMFAVDKSSPYFLKLEKLLKPRMAYFSSIHGEKLIGFVSMLCAISIALPIIFGNAVPSAGIFIMALGLLGKDGLVIIIGIITSIIGLFIASLVVYLFFYGAKMAAGGWLKDLYLYLVSNFGSLGE